MKLEGGDAASVPTQLSLLQSVTNWNGSSQGLRIFNAKLDHIWTLNCNRPYLAIFKSGRSLSVDLVQISLINILYVFSKL